MPHNRPSIDEWLFLSIIADLERLMLQESIGGCVYHSKNYQIMVVPNDPDKLEKLGFLVGVMVNIRGYPASWTEFPSHAMFEVVI